MSDDDHRKSSNGWPIRLDAALRSSTDTELHRIRRVRVVEAGETVLAEGEDHGLFGEVLDGVLKMVRSLPDGSVRVVGLIFPGNTFGHLPSGGSDIAIEAAKRATVVSLRHERLEDLVARNSELERLFLRSALETLKAARDWMIVLGSLTVTQRLARFLLILRDGGGEEADAEASLVSVPISRRDLAAYLGTSPETVSRVIRGFDREGVIRIDGADRVEIVDMRRLRQLADG